MRASIFLLVGLLAACKSSQDAESLPRLQTPECLGTSGSIASVSVPLKEPLVAAFGQTIQMGEIYAPSGMGIPLHEHPGEEFIYVFFGSGSIVFKEAPDIELKVGQGVKVPARTPHIIVAGEHGIRAVSSWIVPEGEERKRSVRE